MSARPRLSEVARLAWELHRANGHPPRYDGPCWGPTTTEREEAQRILRARAESETRP